MPRAFAAMALGGLLLALLASVLVRPTLAFTLGTPSLRVAAKVPPGGTVCERGIAMPPDGEFDRIALKLGTGAHPPLDVRVEDDATRRVLARGRLAGGPDGLRQVVRVGRVDTGRPLAVCVTNDGERPAGVYGGRGDPLRPPSAVIDGRPLRDDLDLAFERAPRSLLSLAPAIADRASLFRAGWVGPWTYGVVLLLVAVAVPALLALALAGLRRESRQ